MKIFISWSGMPSHEVARALKDWLPDVFQALDPADVFLSTEDLAKGTPWFQALGKVLDQSDFGILCLTPENRREAWILFEAGAVFNRVETARVVPLLIGLQPADLESPLRDFNAAGLEKTEIRKLLTAINATLGAKKLAPARLTRAFERCWPDLESVLQAALAAVKPPAQSFAFDVFLSAPMAAFADDAAFQAGRAEFQKVYDVLVGYCGLRVYWAAKDIHTMADYDTMDVSVQADLAALQSSRSFFLLYPERMVTSALFEAGYALALGRESHYFIRQREDLPFLMRELTGAAQNVFIHTQQEWGDYDRLVRKLKKQHCQWFPR